MKKKDLSHVILWMIIPFASVAQAPDAWKSKVDPVVLKKAETNTTFEFVAILKEQANVSAADDLETKEEKALFVYKALKATAEHSQGEIMQVLTKSTATYQSFWLVNSVSITGDLKTLEAVANLSSVKNIIENATYVKSKTFDVLNKSENVRGVTWGITKSKADQAWALGYKGAGVVVAGEDTGYDWTHPVLKKKYRGWDGTNADHNYNWHDAVHSGGGKCGANSKVPCDDDTHGTHTMGTMVGDDGSNQVGMAPDAKWIGCRNMNVGAGTWASYVECFEFFLAPTDLDGKNPDPLKSPHVINNSWGCPTSEGCNSSNFASMETVVNNLRTAGVVVVVSAGNDGPTCNIINSPAAIFTGSFTVGSTMSSDAISSFSSRGPVTNFGPSKISPDISAPGSDVKSAVPGGGFGTKSGTSMAGPHVAGLVALVISANPKLAGRVADIEKIIEQTAVKLKSSENCGGTSGSSIPNNTFGNGRIDALAAVKLAVTYLGVSKADKSLAAVTAFPNPFTGTVNLTFKNWKPGTTLEIYTLTGTQVISKTWETVPADYEIDLSGYASGAYFYKMSNNNEHVNGKIFKIEQQ